MIDENTFKENSSGKQVNDDQINLREIFELYIYHWKWIVVSLFIFIGFSYYYLRTTENQFKMSATILIDDKEGSGMSSELSAFQDLGVMNLGAKKAIITEIGVLKSSSLMRKVVENLNLNISYRKNSKLIKYELYGDDLPIRLNFQNKDSLQLNKGKIFIFSQLNDSIFMLMDSEERIIAKAPFGEYINTDIGRIVLTKTRKARKPIDYEIIIKLTTINSAVKKYKSKLNIDQESKGSSLLKIMMIDNVREKARNILDGLVDQYNIDGINYKSLVTRNTDKFINDRINDISVNLTDVDKGVESFKVTNKLTDIDMETGLNLQSKSALQDQINGLNTQIQMIEYIKSHLDKNVNDLIPANLGLKDDATNIHTNSYNRLILERNRIINSSSNLNPAVINIDDQLATLKLSISQSLKTLESSLIFSLQEAKNREYRLNIKRDEAPQQEREFQDIKRKQQIIESLYLYLLQKREENAISMGIPVPNAKIIDLADGGKRPISPNAPFIYLIGAIFGIILPVSFISGIKFFNNKIKTTDDIEKLLNHPILGDIPKWKNSKIVQPNDTDSFAESIRLLRTNMGFMLAGRQNESKTIFVTSTIGGEGKTFVSINLASSISSIDKKVLVIGADLRKPKIQKYFKFKEKKGLTDYLVDSTIREESIITNLDDYSFDIVSAGPVPPNPTNLLVSGRFENFLSFAKDNYEYIIVDTPPMALVTDTLLISKFADLFIYIIRSNYIDKRVVADAKVINNLERLPNVSLVLNFSEYKKNNFGYGYGYGYGN